MKKKKLKYIERNAVKKEKEKTKRERDKKRRNETNRIKMN